MYTQNDVFWMRTFFNNQFNGWTFDALINRLTDLANRWGKSIETTALHI